MNIKQVISTTKKLINLPYNKFNLENYFSVLRKNKLNPITIDTSLNLPIKLMSGGNFHSRIVTSNFFPKNWNKPFKPSKKPTIYIIGKGILFDSGGYNIKSEGEGSYGMHGDKAGMVIAMNVANYVKGNVVAYCPVTTNFLHNSQITPGDIITIGNKNVEINNTDAEGRLILAETLSMLQVSEDDIVITIATLTGCCSKAVDKAVGVFGDNDLLVEKYLTAAKEEKEYAWRLPMFDYMQKLYNKQPIKNHQTKIIAGASAGAMFIRQFVEYPNNWIHLDIAPVADKDNKATGIPVKSLINFVGRI